MNSTAIGRNFIRTPTIIAYSAALVGYLFVTLSLTFTLGFLSTFPAVIAWAIVCFCLGWAFGKTAGALKSYLVGARFHKWASECYGIPEENLTEFLSSLDPEELEKMVALDLEGWSDEEE